jgi:ATP-binding cassette subfamily B protein/subfamily B ATP-binding cassette protein MsbA
MSQKITPPQLDELPVKGYDPRVVENLIGFIRPYKWRFFISLILMIISSVAVVSGPYFVKYALDEGLGTGSISVLRQAVLLYLLAAAIQWISIYIRVNIMARAGQSIIFDLRSKLFQHLQNLSLNFFSHYSVGRVITRIINDVAVLREFITWAIIAVVRDFVTLFGIILAMISMNLKLSLLTLAVLPLMVLATILFRRKAREKYREVRAAISWVNSVLAENINGIRVVQAFSRENLNFSFFKDTVNQYNLDTNISAAKIASVFFPTIDLLGVLAMALVIWLGGTAAQIDQITPGILVAFVLYIERFFNPIRDLSRRYDSFQSTMAGGERILGLLDAQQEVSDAEDASDLPVIKGEVLFEDVSYHYPDDERPVLTDISLHIHPGETVALVGKTGAGKSTLVKLLSRFYDPTSGLIYIDNHDLRGIRQESLRRQMGIVLQDPFLFSGTVMENIRFGRLLASDHEVMDAAKAVGAHDFIIRLRDGYDSSVEEGGVLLSVGQRQLISFSRALLADPRILILDEATSSVDTQTEQVIQGALTRLLQGRTSFIIAHRLSTVINADRIIVLDNGKIIEEGTHNQLMKVGGRYYQLYETGFTDAWHDGVDSNFSQ